MSIQLLRAARFDLVEIPFPSAGTSPVENGARDRPSRSPRASESSRKLHQDVHHRRAALLLSLRKPFNPVQRARKAQYGRASRTRSR